MHGHQAQRHSMGWVKTTQDISYENSGYFSACSNYLHTNPQENVDLDKAGKGQQTKGNST